ncbi:MAG: DUF4064 domain-containing protein [Myxococcota bacterium]|nr:DUF4064 domain-containing protein [Myxococcota bacterium]
MPSESTDRSVRILRIAGWILGILGLFMLGNDMVGDNQRDNLAGVLFIIAGIATLLVAKNRESRSRHHAQSADESSPEDDRDSSENSA